MKKIYIFLFFVAVSFELSAQDPLLIKRSWIKTKVENLSKQKMAPNNSYLRYTFDLSQVSISFKPAWNEYTQTWKLKGKRLALGYDTYDVVELTDTSLVIKIDGFSKMSFLSEDYISSKAKYLDSIGIFNAMPLYKASEMITPRYAKGITLKAAIQPPLHGLPKEVTFYLTFIVTERGEIQNIKVIKGVTKEFDNEVVNRLQKTSGSWQPAMYKLKPIQTEMFYQAKFLPTMYLSQPKNIMN